MLLLYDHLVAVLIGGFIFLVLVQMQQTGIQAQVEVTRYYASRTQMVGFIEMLQRDFQNVGAGVDPSDQMMVSFSWDDTEKSIEFLATVDTTAGAPVELIKYQLLSVPSQESHCEKVECYEIQRFVHDGTAYQADGKSMNTLTEFEIQLRMWNGSPVVGDLDDTREIFVRVVALSPMGEGGFIKRSRWQTQFRPINLTLQNP